MQAKRILTIGSVEEMLQKVFCIDIVCVYGACSIDQETHDEEDDDDEDKEDGVLASRPDPLSQCHSGPHFLVEEIGERSEDEGEGEHGTVENVVEDPDSLSSLLDVFFSDSLVSDPRGGIHGRRDEVDIHGNEEHGEEAQRYRQCRYYGHQCLFLIPIFVILGEYERSKQHNLEKFIFYFGEFWVL